MKSKIISVKVIAGAKVSAIERIGEAEFRVKLNSKAIENRANLELIELLSDYFSVAKSMIKIKSGPRNINKVIEILS